MQIEKLAAIPLRSMMEKNSNNEINSFKLDTNKLNDDSMEVASLEVSDSELSQTSKVNNDELLILDDASEAKKNKPTISEFIQATKLSFIDATELLYGVVGSNGDHRNWELIMNSENIISTARLATEKLHLSNVDYELGQVAIKGTLEYEKIIEQHTVSNDQVIEKSGLNALVNEGGTLKEYLINANNLKLRKLPDNEVLKQKILWYYNQSQKLNH